MLVQDVMTPIQNTLTPQHKISEAVRLIVNLKVNCLPVKDHKENIIGIVTRDNLMAFWANSLNCEVMINTIKQVISNNFLTIREDTPVLDVISQHCETFLVVNDNGKITGILDKSHIGIPLLNEANHLLLQMQTIIDSAHNGIIAIDKDGIVTIFNHAAEKIIRRSKKEALGKHLSEVIIPQGLLDILKEGKSVRHHKFTVEYSAGKHIYLTNRSPIIENGQVVGAVGVFQDISELEFISEELDSVKQLNEELRCIIESSYDGILITDEKGKIIKANQAHTRITGIPPEKVQGHLLKDLVKKGTYSKSIVKDVLNKKEPVTIIERTPGQNHLLVTGNPVPNKYGKIFRVVINIRDITELNKLRGELEASRELSERYHLELTQLRGRLLKTDNLIFNSQKMQNILTTALRVAQVDSTILILGESGVGKEVFAKLIHNNSNRKKGPFITVNCASIPENLLESEMFGYERGAFTGANREGKPGMFELAHNGTLFLDEIGDLPPTFQVKFLRAIQEREIMRVGGNKPRPVNVRIVAATNRNLESMMKLGKFREDLYFRLNVVPLHIPPLRERKEEIIPLVYTFKKKFGDKYKIEKDFSSDVFEKFLNYHWPGNVRELENIIERLMVTSPEAAIALKDLPRHLTDEPHTQAAESEIILNSSLPLKKAVMELERQLIENALKQYGSTHKAARYLKIDQSTIVRKIKRLKAEGFIFDV